MNETWIVSSAGVNRYALRKYNPSRSAADVETEHRGLKILEELFGSLIAAPLMGKNGATIQTIDDSLFALFPFKEGVSPSRKNSMHIRVAARTLAFLHLKLWHERHLFASMLANRPAITIDRFLPAKEIYDRLASQLNPSRLASWNISYDFFSASEKQASRSFSSLAPHIQDKHLIHGDFGLTNLLIDEESGDICAVLDWEEMRWDAPLFELAGVLPFYDQEHSKGSEIFLTEYLFEIQRLNHPNRESIIVALEYLDDAKYLTNYLELTLMIESGHFESDYIRFLCEMMM